MHLQGNEPQPMARRLQSLEKLADTPSSSTVVDGIIELHPGQISVFQLSARLSFPSDALAQAPVKPDVDVDDDGDTGFSAGTEPEKAGDPVAVVWFRFHPLISLMAKLYNS